MFKRDSKKEKLSSEVDEHPSNEPKIIKAQPIEFQIGEKVLVEHVIVGITIGSDGEPVYRLRPYPDKKPSLWDTSAAYRYINRKQSYIRRTGIDGEYRTVGNE